MSTPDDPDPTFFDHSSRFDSGLHGVAWPVEPSATARARHAHVLLVDPRSYAFGSPELVHWYLLC